MIRLGLCCIFRNEPIKFRRTTARYLLGRPRREQLNILSGICRENAGALYSALEFCKKTGIGAFRLNSQILPLKTHPEVGYDVTDLPDYQTLIDMFIKCGEFCRKNDIRTSFHPDQFILLSSPSEGITHRSVAELIYQNEVAQWVNADVINIHGGGGYGDKPGVLNRLRERIGHLPQSLRDRLTLENDDRVYTPEELIPVCRDTGIGFVYDVHHHRCLPDGNSIEDTTRMALETWHREPLFHISSPIAGWGTPSIRKHHDYINITDFPASWKRLDITVEVEAKAKELAVLKLRQDLSR
ncbi:MAG: UV DNA damage repair endonuclease UvsE [Desulfobacterales bacterium]|nr:UV DNA damage repair endonuclease UvsE [Desulfobacterales bacterium]MDD4071275.1 UV DNA damage repair endonuclease UvsE [Desulfobacterales bacterium]MDD4393332.1 UV DNA damage repair endonuclease UvsE [Desulfobacterales bacterium]